MSSPNVVGVVSVGEDLDAAMSTVATFSHAVSAARIVLLEPK